METTDGITTEAARTGHGDKKCFVRFRLPKRPVGRSRMVLPVAAAIAAGASAAEPAPAVAQNEWTGTESTDWNNKDNWSGVYWPDSSSSLVLIDVPSTDENTPKIEHPNYKSGEKLLIGSEADAYGRLDISDSGELSSDLAHIGDKGTGTVNVTGSGATWTLSERLIVGNSGTGDLIVSGGGTVSSKIGEIGSEDTGVGNVMVTGNGSTWNNDGSLYVGKNGEGHLTVEHGGEVSSTGGEIGSEDTGDGHVTVTGTDSTWTILVANFSVGTEGEGNLAVENGGMVSSAFSFIGDETDSVGSVTVRGSGSTWTSSDDLAVGWRGKGDLTVSEGGEVESTSIEIATNDSSTGTVNIGAAVGDQAVAPGTLVTDGVEFGSGTGTLVFNHTGSDYDFDTKIVSDADPIRSTLDHRITHLAGVTRLTADNTGFGGTTTVDGGTLIVDDTLGGEAMLVELGGTLGGTGTVAPLTLNGTLAPGNPVGTRTVDTLTVDGNATFNSGSTYRVYVDRTGASQTDVKGDATINGGTVDVVSLEDDEDNLVLGTYPILEAETINGEFDDVEDNFAFIDPSLDYDATGVHLTLAVTDDPENSDPDIGDLQPLASPFSGNGNQNALVTVLDTMDQGDPRYQAFVDAFLGLNEDEVTAVLEELSGSRSAGTSGISVSFSTALMDFVQMANGFGGTGGGFGGGAQTASALTPGTIQFASAEPMSRDEWDEVAQAPAPTGAGRTDGPASWVRVVGQTGRQGSANGMPGSDSRSGGLHAGIDMPVNDAFSVGAAIGYEQGRVTSGGMLGVDTESYSGAIYGRYQLDDLRLSGAFSYSRIEYDSSRTVPTFGQQSADYGADAWNIDAQAAYDFRPGPEGLTVSPLVGVRYIGMRQEGYEETGDAGLSVGSLTSDSLRARLGAETRYETSVDDGMTVALTARAAWSREIGSPETALRASLLGSDSFAIQGQGLPRDIAELGVTLDLGITDDVDLFAAYDGSLGDNYTDHRGQAGLRYVW
ncbi:autotransporter domain-containing protein [Fodinicurvata sp. EGI_FJ10296]|uniref:autotransporter family protein n=1 Tax=Fodinicurvata sp. EGI_FJ10296 TaxID=3231908 RepID=UPI0034515359